MRKCLRLVVLSLLGLLSTAVLGAVTALVAAISLAATALIVPGTGTPNANVVGDYMQNYRDYYMQSTPCTDDDDCGPYDPLSGQGMLGINYPATFWPIPLPGWCPNLSCDKFDVSVAKGVNNLDTALTSLQTLGYTGDIVIAGYSQGARVVSIEKMKFVNGEYADLADQVSFVFIGNPNRPNGGILSRFGILRHIPILDVTTGQPTPTGLPDYPRDFPTEDWAIRWEGIADWPLYLFNPLAVLNSILGFYYDHGTYLAINEGSDPGELPAGYDVDTWRDIVNNPEDYPDIVEIQVYGDTTYYTITPKVLPLVRPLHDIPLIGKPIADLIEPALRVIIEETGYNRNIPFGQPAGIRLIPIFNPITLAIKLIPAIIEGIGNFLGHLGLAPAIAPAGPETEMSQLGDGQGDETAYGNLLDESDGFSGSRLQDNADLGQQQGDGESDEKPLVSVTLSENEFVASGTNETGTPPEGTTKTQESVLEQPTAEIVAGSGANGNEVQGTNAEVVGTKDPEENSIDAEGGGMSLSSLPTGPTGGGGAVQPVSPAPTVEAEGAEDSDDSDDSEPAAA